MATPVCTPSCLLHVYIPEQAQFVLSLVPLRPLSSSTHRFDLDTFVPAVCCLILPVITCLQRKRMETKSFCVLCKLLFLQSGPALFVELPTAEISYKLGVACLAAWGLARVLFIQPSGTGESE